MPDDRQYTWAERGQYVPDPPCPHCDGVDADVEWLKASPTQDRWLPGKKTCRNARCPGKPQVEDLFA